MVPSSPIAFGISSPFGSDADTQPLKSVCLFGAQARFLVLAADADAIDHVQVELLALLADRPHRFLSKLFVVKTGNRAQDQEQPVLLLDSQVPQLGDRAAAKYGLHMGRDIMYRQMAHRLNTPSWDSRLNEKAKPFHVKRGSDFSGL
jgi:hypothetical protein